MLKPNTSRVGSKKEIKINTDDKRNGKKQDEILLDW